MAAAGDSVSGSEEHFVSSKFYMFVEIALASLFGGVVGVALLVRLGYGWEDWFLFAGIVLAVILVAFLAVTRWQYVHIVVLAGEAVVLRPGKEPLRINRSAGMFVFSTFHYSFMAIVRWTFRSLTIRLNGKETTIGLPNFSKKTFDLLTGSLRRESVSRQEAPDAAIVFEPPREKMIGEQLRFIAMAFLTVVLGCALLCFVVRFFLFKGMTVEAMGKVFLAGFLLFIVPGAFWTADYLRKKRFIPSRIEITRDGLRIDEQVFPFSELRCVKLTPGLYGRVSSNNSRIVLVEGEREKRRYDLGPREGQDCRKTVFDDYPRLCRSLEKAAAANGFRVIYDT